LADRERVECVRPIVERDTCVALQDGAERDAMRAVGGFERETFAPCYLGVIRMTVQALEVVPTGAALGAEIRGIDLRGFDEAAFPPICQAWLDHALLLVRDQGLLDDDLIAFSRRFGALDQAPIQENGRRFVEGCPEIYVVSNVVENGVAIGSL